MDDVRDKKTLGQRRWWGMTMLVCAAAVVTLFISAWNLYCFATVTSNLPSFFALLTAYFTTLSRLIIGRNPLLSVPLPRESKGEQRREKTTTFRLSVPSEDLVNAQRLGILGQTYCREGDLERIEDTAADDGPLKVRLVPTVLPGAEGDQFCQVKNAAILSFDDVDVNFTSKLMARTTGTDSENINESSKSKPQRKKQKNLRVNFTHNNTEGDLRSNESGDVTEERDESSSSSKDEHRDQMNVVMVDDPMIDLSMTELLLDPSILEPSTTINDDLSTLEETGFELNNIADVYCQDPTFDPKCEVEVPLTTVSCTKLANGNVLIGLNRQITKFEKECLPSNDSTPETSNSSVINVNDLSSRLTLQFRDSEKGAYSDNHFLNSLLD